MKENWEYSIYYNALFSNHLDLISKNRIKAISHQMQNKKLKRIKNDLGKMAHIIS